MDWRGLWGVEVRCSGGAIVDGMLAQTARRPADRLADEGLLDLAQQLRRAANEANRSNAASAAMHHHMTNEDPQDEELRAFHEAEPGEGLIKPPRRSTTHP